MGRKIAILQSNYIPWKGYFDLINRVDHFVIYDCVQYTKNDWRNRNKIISKEGLQWLTIPVLGKNTAQLISETEVANNIWADKHFKTLSQIYAKSEFYNMYADELKECYKTAEQLVKLSDINLMFIKWLNCVLGINTRLHLATDFELADDRIERLTGICQQLGAKTYVSGPAAKNYLKEDKFLAKEIAIEWMEYSGYSKYRQLSEKFEHGVSILDLLFNTGPNAKNVFKQ